MTMRVVTKFLLETKNLIDTPEKWIQDQASNGKGGYCIIGAMNQIQVDVETLTGPGRLSQRNKASDILRQVVGPSIIDFNDTKGRTHDEVMAAFDIAIERSKM